jgi:hypothetical protein
MVNLVAFLWIGFDVLICLRTGYMTAPFPQSEWWAWLLSGGALAGFAFAAQYFESKAHDREMARLRDQMTEQKGIQQGGLSALGLLSGKIIERLDDRADKLGDPELRRELAELKQELDASLKDRKAREWPLLTEEQSRNLVVLLLQINGEQEKVQRRVHVLRDDTSDCVYLAEDLAIAFVQAGWELIKGRPERAMNALMPGIEVSLPPGHKAGRVVLDALFDIFGNEVHYATAPYATAYPVKSFDGATIATIRIGQKPKRREAQ